MKTMLDYLEEAANLLGAVWGDAKTPDLRTYVTKHLADWTVQEQEDLLTLCAAMARVEAEAVDRALWEVQRPGREMSDAATRTWKGLSRFKLREGDRRETERRAAVIDRHFGAALRGGASDQRSRGEAT